MSYDKNRYRGDMGRVWRNAKCTIKNNLKCSVDPRNDPLERVKPTLKIINGGIRTTAQTAWYTLRLLLKK